MNLRKKLFEIQKMCDSFIRDAQSHQHSFVSGTSILKKIRAKMDELGVMLETHITGDPEYNYETHLVKNKYGEEKPVTFTRISVKGDMVWVDVDSEEERKIPWLIVGEHDNDVAQAFGSGSTYSERYFLTKYFKVPTDNDDPDSKKQTEKRMENRSSTGGGSISYEDYAFKGGKMVGQKISEITDKGYIGWVAQNSQGMVKEFAARRLKELGA